MIQVDPGTQDLEIDGFYGNLYHRTHLKIRVLVEAGKVYQIDSQLGRIPNGGQGQVIPCATLGNGRSTRIFFPNTRSMNEVHLFLSSRMPISLPLSFLKRVAWIRFLKKLPYPLFLICSRYKWIYIRLLSEQGKAERVSRGTQLLIQCCQRKFESLGQFEIGSIIEGETTPFGQTQCS